MPSTTLPPELDSICSTSICSRHNDEASLQSLLSPSPTSSWWLQNLQSNLLPASSTVLPEAVDVAIIGAGLTGCATAYWLHRLYGRKSLVIDARGVAGGATGRNGGHLWANPRSDFERATVAELMEFLEAEGVECDLARDGAVALERFAPESGVQYNDAGSSDPESAPAGGDDDWGDTPSWSADAVAARLRSAAGMFSSGAHYTGAMQFYPAKVAAALLRVSAAALVAPVRVLRLEAEPPLAKAQQGGAEGGALPPAGERRQQLVVTDHGTVRACTVVVATNGWAAELLPELRPYLTPARNQVIMTRPLVGTAAAAVRGWPVGGVSVDSDVGAREVYMIRRPDGRLCVGGARALEPGAAVGNADDGSLSAVVGDYLRSFLATAFPPLRGGELEDAGGGSGGGTGSGTGEGEGGCAGGSPGGGAGVEVEAEWTGVLAFTRDGRPLIGAVRPGVLVAVGFCGHGMPQCTGAGKALAQMIGGGDGGSSGGGGGGGVHPFVSGPANVARVLRPAEQQAWC